MLTLFPGDLATKEKPYGTLAAMWAAFSSLKHNTSPAINGRDFRPLPRALNTRDTHIHTSTVSPVTYLQTTRADPRRGNRPPKVSTVSQSTIRHDPFSYDYGLWPFDDRDYGIVCTVTDIMNPYDISLWIPRPLLT